MAERRQVAFWLEPDLVEHFDAIDNKTRLLNDALRLYFAGNKEQIEDRLIKLEEFRRQFIAYFKRTNNEPHSEFCECGVCISNRHIFGDVGAHIQEQKSGSVYPEPRSLSSTCRPGWEFTTPIPGFDDYWGVDFNGMIIKHDQYNQNGRWGWKFNADGKPESTGKISHSGISVIVPKRFEKIVDILSRAVERAKLLKKPVVFESSEYLFEITGDSDISAEYEKYMDFVNQKDPNYISIKMQNAFHPKNLV